MSSDFNLSDHIHQESKEKSWSHSSVLIARVNLLPHEGVWFPLLEAYGNEVGG